MLGSTKVSFINGSGLVLSGVLNIKDERSNDIVVLCHGMFCDKNTPLLTRIDEGLSRNSFRFDFAGNGESDGDLKYSNYYEEAEDVRSAIAYLRKQGYKPIALVGHSKGALSCMIYVTKYRDVPMYVDLAGRFYMDKTPASRFTKEQLEQLETDGQTLWKVGSKTLLLTKQMMEERAGINVEDIARHVNASCLIIHGGADETISWEDAIALSKCLKNSEVLIVPGANHFFSRSGQFEPVVEKIESWINSCCPLVSQNITNMDIAGTEALVSGETSKKKTKR